MVATIYPAEVYSDQQTMVTNATQATIFIRLDRMITGSNWDRDFTPLTQREKNAMRKVQAQYMRWMNRKAEISYFWPLNEVVKAVVKSWSPWRANFMSRGQRAFQKRRAYLQKDV